MAQTLDDIYSKYQQPTQDTSLDSLYNKYSGGSLGGSVPTATGSTPGNSPSTLQDKVGSFVKGAADFVADPFRELGLAAHNMVTSPENDITSYQNFSGDTIDTPGYIKGKEASPWDITKQVAGAGIGVASTVLPFLKGAKALELLKASPVLTGLGEGYAQDISQNTKEGNLSGTALLPGINTVGGGVLGTTGKVLGKILTPAEDLQSNALKQGLDTIYNKNQSVKNALAKNTVTQTTTDALGNKTKNIISPDETFIKNQFKPNIVDGRVDTTHLYDKATKEGAITDIANSLDNAIDTKLASSQIGQTTIPISDFKQGVIDAINNNPVLKREGKISSMLSQLESKFADYEQSYPNGIDINEINAIRKTMNNPKVFDASTYDINRAIGDASRNFVYKANPEVQGLLQQKQLMEVAKNYAVSLNGKVVKGGALGNMFWSWFGQKLGAATGIPVVGDILGLMGGKKFSQALQQLTFTSPVGELKSGISNMFKNSGMTQQEIEVIIHNMDLPNTSKTSLKTAETNAIPTNTITDKNINSTINPNIPNSVPPTATPSSVKPTLSEQLISAAKKNYGAAGLGVTGLSSASQPTNMDANQRSQLNNNATTSLGMSNINPTTKVEVLSKDNPVYNAYDSEIANAEKLVQDKLGIQLPKGFIKTILAQESSLGTNSKNYNSKLGENAWLVGLTDVAKKDIANRMKGDFAIDPTQTDPNTVQGAINSAALYAGLKMRPSKGQDKEGNKIIDTIIANSMKDVKNLYKAYNGGGTKGAEEDFKKRYDYISK